jgi:hypothetical protein
MDGDDLDAQFPARPEYTQGNLTPVGNQNFTQHEKYL